ncbi:MAG: hypothetical protein EOP24_39555 [Hyphomicrobiales bacterium]|nr:MAG: hypothetical protein EOP24_39555 [Hyphomicrobiales bacterium]
MTRATTYLQISTFVGALLGPLGFGFIVEFGSYKLAFTITAAVAALGGATIAAGNRFERSTASTFPSAGVATVGPDRAAGH